MERCWIDGMLQRSQTPKFLRYNGCTCAVVLPRNQIWDVPASGKTETGAEIVEETSCALLLLDLDDRNSFRVAKRWQTLITEGENSAELVKMRTIK